MHAGVEYVGVIRGSLCRGVGVKGGGGIHVRVLFLLLTKGTK